MGLAPTQRRMAALERSRPGGSDPVIDGARAPTAPDRTDPDGVPDRLWVQGFIATLRRVLVMVSSSGAFVEAFR